MVFAAYSNDVLKLGLMSVGIEHYGSFNLDISRGVVLLVPSDIPYSHGLFMSIVWSVLAAGIAYYYYRDRRTAIVIWLTVISHWLLDFIVHPPELRLLFNNSPMVGLGLWTTPHGYLIANILEVVMLVSGIALYLTHNKKRTVSVDK